MDTLESLSEALETTGDIQSIVRTMKALSSVSIRQYEHAESAMADYARTVELGLMALLRQRRQAGLPLPETTRRTGREALIVIGSDRGLCGGYNDKITRFALSHMGDRPMVLGVIGARVLARLEAHGRPANAVHLLPGSVEGLTRLVQAMIVEIDRWIRNEGVGEVDAGAVLGRGHAHDLEEAAHPDDDLAAEGIGMRQEAARVGKKRDDALLGQVGEPGLLVVRVGGEQRPGQGAAAGLVVGAGKFPGQAGGAGRAGDGETGAGRSGDDGAAADQGEGLAAGQGHGTLHLVRYCTI